MKTLIVGAGIIGVIYGWALAQAGVDVTHFVRKGRKGQFKDGVNLDLLDDCPFGKGRWKRILVSIISGTRGRN